MKNLIKKIVPSFLLNWYHFCLSFLGALIYRFPSKKIKVIGITGTKGKSTVVNLAGRILEEKEKVGWISSLTLKVGEKEILNPFHMTMPGRFFIQRTLREMVNQGCHYALIEVTSEGILQHRQRFIDFEVAVFTNLAPEHIESHGGFENYRKTKGKLFQKTKNIHILNLDDRNVEYFLKFPAEKKYGYTTSEKNREHFSVIKAENIQILSSGLKFSINNLEFNLKLLGEFNVYNSLAAICLGLSQGIDLKTSKRVLEKINKIPGRMEIIEEGQNFKVIIDLAHTPESFKQVFKLVKKFPHHRIISLFGSAGGGRDKWKRPELGKIAAQYSDFIILTNEDPYNEKTGQILSQIKSGILENQFPISNLYEIIDRRKAIKKALNLAQKNDIVLILGKGAEQTMIIGSKSIPWDDRKVVKEELFKIKNK